MSGAPTKLWLKSCIVEDANCLANKSILIAIFYVMVGECNFLLA